MKDINNTISITTLQVWNVAYQIIKIGTLDIKVPKTGINPQIKTIIHRVYINGKLL